MMMRRRSLRMVAEERVEAIPASKWGVTKEQFREFVEVVRVSQDRGLLRNLNPNMHSNSKSTSNTYSMDKFENPLIGPTIYQVNEQIIKPFTKGTLSEQYLNVRRRASTGYHWGNLAATQAVPKSSWSLMKNPSGVDVDLFVSHAWGEGIYEFANHLLQVWPPYCNAAYICFLSNPQHLDMSHVVGRGGKVQESAFFKALQSRSMKQVVMIATRNVQIHTRIWCCLEAYVAMKRNLPVIIGGDERYLNTMNQRAREFVKRKRLERQKRKHLLQRQLITMEMKIGQRQFKLQFLLAVAVVTGIIVVMGSNPDELLMFLGTYGLGVILAYSMYMTRDGIGTLWPLTWKRFRGRGTILRPVFAILHLLVALVRLAFERSIDLYAKYNKDLERSAEDLKKRAEKAEKRMLSEEIHELNHIKSVAVDVAEAEASSEEDRISILEAIGDDAELVNRMLTRLILG